jgi:hypothetical protein
MPVFRHVLRQVAHASPDRFVAGRSGLVDRRKNLAVEGRLQFCEFLDNLLAQNISEIREIIIL